jgi:nicotinate-nucleotide--dimethylbenzimidazole phosphoribosyltransferase
MKWTHALSATFNTDYQHQALVKQKQLTKPSGSLGQLEEIAVQLSAMQETEMPHIHKPYIAIFAGDHGIAVEGVSAFPQVVTIEMIRNFARGGAAINVLAKAQGAVLQVYNCGTVNPVEALEGVTDCTIAQGTANFLHHSAMTEAQLIQALNIGKQAVETALAQGCDLFIAGEMGIANTTSATACASALLATPPAMLAGRGTGVDDATLLHKISIIEQALEKHHAQLITPLAILQTLGGFEIAAMTGAYFAAAQHGLPMLIDGFISSVAALIATQHNFSVRDWMLFAHTSAERGHASLLKELEATPLLHLGMRLGEGSGAGVAISLLRLACDLHNQMATFHDAQVSHA